MLFFPNTKTSSDTDTTELSTFNAGVNNTPLASILPVFVEKISDETKVILQIKDTLANQQISLNQVFCLITSRVSTSIHLLAVLKNKLILEKIPEDHQKMLDEKINFLQEMEEILKSTITEQGQSPNNPDYEIFDIDLLQKIFTDTFTLIKPAIPNTIISVKVENYFTTLQNLLAETCSQKILSNVTFQSN